MAVEYQYKDNIRNLYNDNIKDVFSIDDLDSLKENGYMNVLANQDDYVMIEAGDDFWKIDTKKGEVIQFRDFVSLQNQEGGELVYSRDNPSINKDYGAVLYDTVIESDCKKLPKFTLEDRKDYLKNTTEGLVAYQMKGQFEQDVKKNRQESKEISSNISESVNKPETKFISDSIQIATDIMTIIFTFLKNKVDKNRREKFINGVMDKLDKKEMSPADVKALMKEYPELEQLLFEWQKSRIGMDIETSTTIDNALKNKQNNNTNVDIKEGEPLKLESAKNIITIGEGKKEDQTVETLLKQTDEQMEQMYGSNFQEKVQHLFLKSHSDDSLDYASNLLDEKVLEELKADNPDINKVDCAKAIAYINHLIEDGNNDSKGILMEKMSDNSLGVTNNKVLFNIIDRMIKRGEELVKQQERKQSNF